MNAEEIIKLKKNALYTSLESKDFFGRVGGTKSTSNVKGQKDVVGQRRHQKQKTGVRHTEFTRQKQKSGTKHRRRISKQKTSISHRRQVRKQKKTNRQKRRFSKHQKDRKDNSQ